jgi:hypothetical protein
VEIMFRRGGRLLLGGFALACLMLLTSCALLTDVPNQTAKWVIIPEDIPGGIYISIDFLSSGIGGTSLAEKGDVGSRTLYFIIGDPDADVNVEYRKVG